MPDFLFDDSTNAEGQARRETQCHTVTIET